MGHVFKRKASKHLIKSLNKHTLSYYYVPGPALGTGHVTVASGADSLDGDRHTHTQRQEIITNAMKRIKLGKGLESDQEGRDREDGELLYTRCSQKASLRQ